jgi:dipeptidyl aminopeptidase/acylaminoacyl peptidase
MSNTLNRPVSIRAFTLVLAVACTASLTPVTGLSAQSTTETAADSPRPMTFLDVQEMRSWGSPAPSPDGGWLLHTVTTPDWQADDAQTDIHIVSLEEGTPSSRRLTFSEADDTDPTWSPDGDFFVFRSNRDAPSSSPNRTQLYLMRTDGGEARRITDASEGVSNFAFSPEGRWLVFRSGERGEEQLHRLPTADLTDPSGRPGGVEAEAVTSEEAGVQAWEWAPDGERIYYIAPDSVNEGDRQRREKGFTVDIRNQETPLSSLRMVEMGSLLSSRLAGGTDYSVTDLTVSPDGRWVGFVGGSTERYERNITQERLYSDLYLLDTSDGSVERLTETFEAGPAGPFFSPDGRWVAFTAPDELNRYTMGNRRLYLRAVDDRGGDWEILGRDFDGHVSVSFWSDDGNTVYFNEGIRATRQLMALDLATDEVRQVTREDATIGVSRDDETGTLLVNYQDPYTPSTLYHAASSDALADRSRWTRLTDVNPQIGELSLGETRVVTWRAPDGEEVEGVLTLPVDYEPGRRYPLIVAIHGGPASADVLRFNGGYGSQIYAGAGYVVLKPNYRGSSNYGEAFRTGIVGNYFPPGYDDIMAGVDHLIAEGIVDGDRMGALGWSAGGHWSNWILVNTDRFRAISSGAGTSNWISMYAQSDVQRNRQYYLGDELLYHDFEPYWEQSPLKYIANASTPTMIHVVEGDPRVPSPQSVELHMALVQLGVPTELFMYPGSTHGIPDARNRLLKSVSEMAWMDYWVRDIGEGFQWDDVLATLDEEAETAVAAEDGSGGL